MPNPTLFSQSVLMNMLHLRERLMGYFRPILTRHGLTEQQFRTIRYLYENPDSSIETIGRGVCISAPSLTGVLTRMESNNWITRRADDADKRRTYISLTPTAQTLHNTVMDDTKVAYEEMAQTVGKSEIQILQSIMDCIHNNLDKSSSQQ